MRARAKKIAHRALDVIPLPLWQGLFPRREFVFCYHLAGDRPLPHISNIYHFKTASMFADDLAYLQRQFEIVDLDGFLQRRYLIGPNDQPLALITFDDGLAEAFTIARPILKDRGIPAVFFITTDFIDNRSMFYRHKASLCIEQFKTANETTQAEYLTSINTRYDQHCSDQASFARFVLAHRADRAYVVDQLCEMLDVDMPRYLAGHRPYMTTEQIKTLQAEGFSIGAHTTSHRDFQNLTSGQIHRQIIESCRTIAELTGVAPVPFAFPFTLRGLDRAPIFRIVRDNPIIGPLFGTSGLRIDPPFIHRIFSDDPTDARPGRSNIPRLMSAQFQSLLYKK